jgi:hypothetical protein
MTIDKIYNEGNLSVRAYHACKYNEIETIVDLKNYFLKHKTFQKFRNCGEKSNLELIQLCDKFPNEVIIENVVEENLLVNKIQKLNRLQRQVINRFIKISTSELKVRSRNAINLYFNGATLLKNFSVKIFEKDNFQVSKIKNIGKRYIPELELYIDKIKTFIEQVSEINNEKELISLNNRYLIQNTFSIEDIPNEVLHSQSIVKLCEFLIKKNTFFKEDYTIIFTNTINVFNTNCKTLDETALLTNLTRERVRQIRERCFLELFDKLSFLKNFEDDLYQNYEIDINDELIIISEEKVDEINFIYDTHFSNNFLIYILSSYLSDSFNLIGNIEDVLIPKQFNARNRHNWKNIYLIKNELKELISIDKLIEDISVRKQARINETYKFNFKSYLSKFLNTDNFRILENIKDDCEKIINEEFNFFLDLDENIVFKRNTIKTAPEYAFEALENLGKPSKVKEIYFKIIELFPDFKTDTNKVRASLKRKDGFVPIGRRSIFGLQKWENQLDNFKGGTIRSIIKEYLDNSNTPKHITEITEYVLQYRPKTNEYSIIQNLKLDESKMFKFFENAVIGVSGKKYESSFTILNSKSRPIKRTWEESYNVLRDFITENNRLPFSSNCTESEEIIYRWFNVQKNKITLNKLSIDQTNLINNILDDFQNHSRRRSKENHSLDNVLDFVQKNQRLPSANKIEERNLYQFFYKQRKQYERNELEDELTPVFFAIAKEIQNIKYENSRN